MGTRMEKGRPETGGIYSKEMRIMKMNFDLKRNASASAQRSVVMGRRSMAASSQHLATLAGHRLMAAGGNAVDAAVGMVAVLSVVEPYMVSIGGDAFALIYLAGEKKLVGMNATGRAPAKAELKWFRDRGLQAMPERGILPVTVPGALSGWSQAVERYGRLSLGEVLADAIHYAENGFPVTEVISGEWQTAEPILKATPSAARTFLIDGRAPRPGEIFRNPDLARTFSLIADQGPDCFYRGEIGSRIARFFEEQGGLITLKDLEAHHMDWVEPLRSDYRGFTVAELPPNGQGVTALEMLNILEGYDLSGLGPHHPDYLHRLIEAKKIAFSDRDYFITDPEFESVPVEKFMSREYGALCRDRIDPRRAAKPSSPATSTASDTVYVTAVDEDRNAVSFISSIFMAFGSGMVVDGTGIVLQNRGSSFSLDPGHPNRIMPGKRTRHTLIPGMLFQGDDFQMSFGIMGGDMQPQGHVQFLVNMIDFGMNPQEAMDTPRVRHMQDLDVYFEDGLPRESVEALERMGHRPDKSPQPVNAVGGGQAVYLDRERDVLLGASDRRKDGCALGC